MKLIHLNVEVQPGLLSFSLLSVAETEPLRPYDDSYDEKTPHHHPESEAPISEKYAPSHFSDRYPPSERQAVPPPRPRNDEDDYMHDDPSK